MHKNYMTKVTRDGGAFLRREGYLDETRKEASWVFISDNGLDNLYRYQH